MLPVEAHMMARLPSSRALAMATTMPRSLKDPVGLHPSSLKYNSGHPSSAARRFDLTSGVSPSPIVIMGVALVTGRKSRYVFRTPRPICHPQILLAFQPGRLNYRLLFYPQHVANPANRFQCPDGEECLLHRRFPGGMGHDYYFCALRFRISVLLQDRRNTDPLIPKGKGDLGQHTGTVSDEEANVVSGLQGIYGQHAQLLRQLTRPARSGIIPHQPGSLNEITQDRTGGRTPTSTHAVEQHLAA